MFRVFLFIKFSILFVSHHGGLVLARLFLSKDGFLLFSPIILSRSCFLTKKWFWCCFSNLFLLLKKKKFFRKRQTFDVGSFLVCFLRSLIGSSGLILHQIIMFGKSGMLKGLENAWKTSITFSFSPQEFKINSIYLIVCISCISFRNRQSFDVGLFLVCFLRFWGWQHCSDPWTCFWIYGLYHQVHQWKLGKQCLPIKFVRCQRLTNTFRELFFFFSQQQTNDHLPVCWKFVLFLHLWLSSWLLLLGNFE